VTDQGGARASRKPSCPNITAEKSEKHGKVRENLLRKEKKKEVEG